MYMKSHIRTVLYLHTPTHATLCNERMQINHRNQYTQCVQIHR